jgi:hypothetical protein
MFVDPVDWNEAKALVHTFVDVAVAAMYLMAQMGFSYCFNLCIH